MHWPDVTDKTRLKSQPTQNGEQQGGVNRPPPLKKNNTTKTSYQFKKGQEREVLVHIETISSSSKESHDRENIRYVSPTKRRNIRSFSTMSGATTTAMTSTTSNSSSIGISTSASSTVLSNLDSMSPTNANLRSPMSANSENTRFSETATPKLIRQYGRSGFSPHYYYGQNSFSPFTSPCNDDLSKDDTDGASASSHNTSNEEYIPVKVNISKKSGEIIFEIQSNRSAVNDSDIDDGDGVEDTFLADILDKEEFNMKEYGESQNDDDISMNSCANSHDGTVITKASHYKEIEHDTSVNGDNINDNNRSSCFEMTSTKNQSHKDHVEKEFEQIRTACLKVAAESYSKLNLDVPDLILAEINENRNKQKHIDDGQHHDQNIFINLFHNNNNNKKNSNKDSSKDSKDNSKDTIQDKLEEMSSSSSNRVQEKRLAIKQFKLTDKDEIHASPCQCALSLVGIKGVLGSGLSTRDGESMFCTFLGINTGGEGGKESQPSSTTALPVDESLVSKTVPTTEAVEPYTPPHPPSTLQAVKKTTRMVRTSSAYVDSSSIRKPIDIDTSSTQAWDDKQDRESTIQTPKRKGGIVSHHSESIASRTRKPSYARSDSRDLVGYHEITLIRNSNSKDSKGYNTTGNEQSSGEQEKEFLDWDAITIKCANHDELDILIQALKASSNATVVPFSSNPKEKIKKMKMIQKLKNSRKPICTKIESHIGMQRFGSLLKRSRTKSAEIPQGELSCIHYNEQYKANSERNEKNALVEHMDESKYDDGETFSDKKKETSLTFNKKEFCELCDKSFTFFSRRHHCRKCSRSCCGGCSSMKKGADGKRYCTDCFDEVSETFDKSFKREEEASKEIVHHKKRAWDFNFNKKEYCELCDLHFTLLTRRHHCRKCERSCCGHCSTVLLVKGGDEVRYCNRCSADILRKQSEALHKRLRTRQSRGLPGKVHTDCHRLGVGVGGKLPHWKNYVTFDPSRRPAVGRLTVEVIEAMALPSVDMVNGLVDSYVRATITGYDRDMKWTLREWMPSNRFSLCSGYCTSTLSPQWRGCGRKGGELLTLPVLCTAGAVLRLEVLHYNVMTHARGKDTILGAVEIPLSDLPNANLRQPEGLGTGRKRFDGYCDRWYRLLPTNLTTNATIVLSKPIPSPHSTSPESEQSAKEKPGKGIKSLEEIGKRAQGLFIAPVEWFASAIKLDLPARRPEAICEEHKARSTIHVRIKLNALESGDLLSHMWFPPVKPYPSIPPFDPDTLLNRMQQVSKLSAPYRNVFQHIEHFIKWKKEPIVCVRGYFIFALHLFAFPHLLPLLHIYLLIFLTIRLRLKLKQTQEKSANDSDLEETVWQAPSIDSLDLIDEAKNTYDFPINGENGTSTDFRESPSLQELRLSTSEENLSQKPSQNTHEEETEETARLSKAVSWLAKKLGDNRGLEVMQHKLGCLRRDIRNVNSVWDGSNILLTKAAMVCLSISFILHFLVDRRILWIIGTCIWYFAQSPTTIRCARASLGFWRGVAKITRRRHLLDAETLELAEIDEVDETQR